MMIVFITPSDSQLHIIFQMRLWAFLSVSAWVCVAVGAQDNSTHRRTKRQFEADHCDPAYCQIPVSFLACSGLAWSGLAIRSEISFCDINRKSDGEQFDQIGGKV